MAIMTTGTIGIADTFKTMYARDLLMEAEPLLLHQNFGVRGRLVNGKTVEFRKFAALPTKTGVLTEGVTPSPDSLSMTKIEATAEQVGAWVPHSDLVPLTAYDDYVGETARLQGDQAGRTYDYRSREVLNQGSAVWYVGQTARGDITTSDILTPTVVKKIVRNLRGNNARPFVELGNTYAAIIDEMTEYDLLNSTEFKDQLKNQPEMQEKFGAHYLGTAFGVTWFRTTEAKVFTGEGNGGIDVHSTVFFGQGAYGVYTLQDLEYIIKQVDSGGTENALNQRGSLGWKGSFITKILFDAYMYRAEHAVTA